MIQKYLLKMGVLIVLVLIPSLVIAKPLININIKAEVETTVKEAGKTVKKMVEAKDVEPGTVVFYTVFFRNDGNEKATNAVIENQIPKDTSYVAGSAQGKDAEITFSIDGGKSYNKPNLIFYEFRDQQGKTVKRVASSDKYTNIHWLIPVIEAGAQGTVSYKVIVK